MKHRMRITVGYDSVFARSRYMCVKCGIRFYVNTRVLFENRYRDPEVQVRPSDMECGGFSR